MVVEMVLDDDGLRWILLVKLIWLIYYTLIKVIYIIDLKNLNRFVKNEIIDIDYVIVYIS